MTTEEDEARIRELATLIESEKDVEKMVILAAELERLLRLKLERQKNARAAECGREAAGVS